MALRFDKTKLDGPKLDDSGFLTADAHATRTGVFVYHHPDGTITRELRHPDDILKADSINTLKNRPITDGHPIEGKVTSKNTKRLSVGMAIDDPKHDGRYVDTKIQINDESAIKKILDEDNPLRELSCGYEAKIIKEDGIYQGEAYDHRQTNVKYNHIALVRRGRAGPEVRLQLDAADASDDPELVNPEKLDQNDGKSKPKPRGDSVMPMKIKRPAVTIRKYKRDAFEVKVDEGDVESGEKAVEIVLAHLDGATEHIHVLEKEIDHLGGRINAMRDDGKVNLDELNDLVKERTDVMGAAHAMGLKDYGDMETDLLKKAVVVAAYPSVKIDDLSDDHIAGRYDTIIEGLKAEGENLKALNQLKGSEGRQDSAHLRSRFPVHGDDISPRDKFLHDTQDMHLSEEERKLNA